MSLLEYLYFPSNRIANSLKKTLFYKKVAYRKAVPEWLKPQESFSSSSKKFRKFSKILYVETDN